METLQAQQLLGARFRLSRTLGRGGMGEVWLAQDLELDEAVALKILRPELVASAPAVDSLRLECRLARRLAHPHIVRLYDLHRLQDRVFVSMEYVEGGDLRRLRGSTWQQLLRLMLPVVEALSYAHGQGVVHRDLKPSNVLVDIHEKPRLADFGVGGIAGQSVSVTAGGSPYTMSPQQLAGQSPSVADDIYGLGTLLYELLHGRLPGDNNSATVRLQAPSADSSQLPPPLIDLITSMMAPAVAERPRDMSAVYDAIATLLGDADNRTLPPGGNPRQPAPSIAAVEPLSAESPTVILPRAVAVEEGNKQRTVAVVLGALFFGLLALGAGVFFYLPRMVAEQSEQVTHIVSEPEIEAATANDQQSDRKPVEQPDAETQMAHRQTAEDALRDLTEVRQRLEDQAVSEWAAEDFEAALEEIAQADELFLNQRFEQATGAYRSATMALAEIEKRTAKVLQSTLAAAGAALAAADSDGAVAAYALALKIEPGNVEAQEGLRRAETLDPLLGLLADGRKQEQLGDLQAAASTYQQALELDSKSTDATEALERVKTRIQEQAFSSAMSEGLNALNSGDLQEARSAFARAKKLDSDAPEVKDALAQLELKARLQQIAGLKARAAGREKQEQWAEAEKLYAQALALDPTLVFARDGAKRTGHYARISGSVEGFLNDPTRLYSSEARMQARELVSEADKIVNAPASIERKVERLRKGIEIAAQPVPVELLSDNQTEVTVYRIGRLGRFERHRLELPPGTYTVVGSRSGYRDVRHTLTLRPGNRVAPVMVRCEERV